MPEITVDLREAVSFEAISPGTYPMIVDAVTGPESGPKSTYMIAEFRFDDPELAKKHGKVFRNLPITGAGAGFFRDFWRKTVGEKLPDDEPISVDTEDAVGAAVTCEIENEEWEGVLRNKIKRIVG